MPAPTLEAATEYLDSFGFTPPAQLDHTERYRWWIEEVKRLHWINKHQSARLDYAVQSWHAAHLRRLPQAPRVTAYREIAGQLMTLATQVAEDPCPAGLERRELDALATALENLRAQAKENTQA